MADPVLTVPRAWVESIDADRERLVAENARLRDQLEAAAMVRARLEQRATLQARALDRMAHVNRSAARALRDENRRLYARRRELDPAMVLVLLLVLLLHCYYYYCLLNRRRTMLI